MNLEYYYLESLSLDLTEDETRVRKQTTTYMRHTIFVFSSVAFKTDSFWITPPFERLFLTILPSLPPKGSSTVILHACRGRESFFFHMVRGRNLCEQHAPGSENVRRTDRNEQSDWLPGTLQICDQKTRRGLTSLLHSAYMCVYRVLFSDRLLRDFYNARCN